MSKYKGLFTFDEDNHRYVPIAQADEIIGVGKTRKIAQYDKRGNYIRTWANAYQVQKELGINHGNINSCVNKHRKTAGGYRWEAICV